MNDKPNYNPFQPPPEDYVDPEGKTYCGEAEVILYSNHDGAITCSLERVNVVRHCWRNGYQWDPLPPAARGRYRVIPLWAVIEQDADDNIEAAIVTHKSEHEAMIVCQRMNSTAHGGSNEGNGS